MIQPILEMRNITKRFAGVVANDQVNLSLYPGEIHALLGENGAGKSTLMNILTGIYAPNEGSVYLKGERVRIRSPKNAIELGIGMVHQHFKLIDTLTVAENVLLNSRRCKFFLKKQEMNREILECSRRFNMEIDPAAKIWQLSVGEQQRVEIVKQLYFGADILILDEPTAVLTPQETAELFKNLHKMADEGKSVLFITHKLYEVMTFSSRITVMKDGRCVGTMLTQDTDRQALAKLMVGREINSVSSRRATQAKTALASGRPDGNAPGEQGAGMLTKQAVVLSLDNVSVLGSRGVKALAEIDLQIHAGEIVGIAGVAGSGQRELSEVITGLRKPLNGKISLYGEDITNIEPKGAKEKGIGFIPEDRMTTGLVGSLNMLDNAMLRDYDSAECSNHGFLRSRNILQRTEAFVRRYEIKNAGLHKPVSLMSGGNLQKLLAAREVYGQPKLIVATYPVHGLDIGATEMIHRILVEQCERGAAVLLISEDLEELFELADRVAALCNGRLIGIVEIDEVTEDTYVEVGRLMLGLEPEVAAQ